MYEGKTLYACINSLDGESRPVTVLEYKGNNRFIVDYNGIRCTAFMNPIHGLYADDKYGILPDKSPATRQAASGPSTQRTKPPSPGKER